MIFEQIPVGGDRNFAYIVGDEESRRAAVVDPAYRPGKVLERAKDLGLEVVYLVNTHGHYDHSDGNDHVLSHTKARLFSGRTGVADGERISMGSVELTFIRTPGHSGDSLCLLATEAGSPGKLMTGDTLFVGKVGGTGYGKDAREEYESLHKKLMTLPEETEVWPGHDVGVSPSSTIGREKRTNPFILCKDYEEFLHLKKNWLQYKREHGIE